MRGAGGQASTAHGFVGSLGHTSEADTGLVYMRARWMDPATGRFLSEDPAGQGSNWLVYCGDDPVGHQDFTGCEAFVTMAQRVLNLLLECNQTFLVGGGGREPMAILQLEEKLVELGKVANTAQLMGEMDMIQGQADVSASALLGPAATIGQRIGQIEEGIGAQTLAYGSAAKLAIRTVEEMILVLQNPLSGQGM